MSAQNANIPEDYIALPLKAHTILGVCEGIGEDFGFNPVFLRVPFAAAVLWSPTITLATYFLLGAAVLVSRLLFPRAKPAASIEAAPAANAANEQTQLAK